MAETPRGVQVSYRGLARRILREGLARLRVRRRLRGVERSDPIFVYQMGKVGSNTVARMVETLVGPSRPVIHVHTLVAEHIQRSCARRRASGRSLSRVMLRSSHLLEKLSEGPFPLSVITLTREPVDRAISLVFQDWRRKLPEARGTSGLIDPELVCTRLRRLLAEAGSASDPGRWFDAELRSKFGVDVMGQPYDFERGYSILRGGEVPTLVLRMEDLDRSLAAALADFFELPEPAARPRRVNVGDHKWYAADLERVRSALRLDPDVLERIVSSRYFRHFYASAAADVTARWSGRRG